MFLPKAAQAHIDVWVYLTPPTEGPPHGDPASEPFKLDYPRWAEEIARLSLQYPNLTGWVMDDFYANHKLFTPEYTAQLRARAKAINPRLPFLPLMYFPEITSGFADAYRDAIDGVVVAYPRDRDEINEARTVLEGESAAKQGELSCPWNTPSRADDYVSASISARVVSPERAHLEFQESDDYTGPTAGYHFKQLLVNGTVIWEQDVAGGTKDWQAINVNVSPQVRGQKTVTLTFRLFDKKGVSNFGVRWRLKNLRAEGLRLTAGLDKPARWAADRQGPFEVGFGAAVKKSEPRFHIPFILMTAASTAEFKLRHGEPASPERMAAWLRMCLRAWKEGMCDGVVTYCVDKKSDSPVFPLMQQAFGECRKRK